MVTYLFPRWVNAGGYLQHRDILQPAAASGQTRIPVDSGLCTEILRRITGSMKGLVSIIDIRPQTTYNGLFQDANIYRFQYFLTLVA